MQTITLSNQKGGVAKTTTCNALATGLAKRGYKVLALDLDPQCNFSFSAGLDMLNIEKSAYTLMCGRCSTDEAITGSNLGFDIIPGGIELAAADMEFVQIGREHIIAEALRPVADRYDYCIIDTPPTLGVLTMNALTASNKVVVPMLPDIYSLQGLAQFNGMVSNVRRYSNADLQIAGLLLTKYSDRQTINRVLKDEIAKASELLQTKLFSTKIRESVAVKEAAMLKSNMYDEAPKANAVQDYESFISELLEG